MQEVRTIPPTQLSSLISRRWRLGLWMFVEFHENTGICSRSVDESDRWTISVLWIVRSWVYSFRGRLWEGGWLWDCFDALTPRARIPLIASCGLSMQWGRDDVNIQTKWNDRGIIIVYHNLRALKTKAKKARVGSRAEKPWRRRLYLRTTSSAAKIRASLGSPSLQ
jgi:hypothetical protein